MTDIPVKKLKQGQERSSKHIASLIKSSQILYDSKQYEQSLALSILAREELTKLIIIQNHLKEGTPINFEEWKKLTRGTKKETAHKIRLTLTQKIMREALQKLSLEEHEALEIQGKRLGDTRKGMTYEQIMSATEENDKIYEQFDQFKQECFYLGWDGNFFTLSTKLDLNELQGLAYANLTVIKQNYYTTISIHIHKEITVDMEPTIRHDPNFKEYLAIRKEIKSNHSQKLVRLAIQAANKLKL